MGPEPVAVLRALPHLRGAEHRPPAEPDRRVDPAHAEALRRHRADPGYRPRARAGQPARPGRGAADESDARLLPDPQRRQALRAGHLRGHANPLAGPVRLAPPVRSRAGGQRQLLPRAGCAHGHQGHPGNPPAVRRLPRPLRGGVLRFRRGRPGGVRGDPEADGHVRAEPLRPPRGGELVRQGADGRPAARRLPLPQALPVAAEPGHRGAAAARPGGAIPARPASRCSPGSCRTSAATRTATRSTSSAPSRQDRPSQRLARDAITCFVCRPVPRASAASSRSRVSKWRPLPGRIRASGRIRCTGMHQELPGARILPDPGATIVDMPHAEHARITARRQRR